LTKAPQPSDVLSIFAGLRPLVGKGDKTSEISRDHSLIVSPSGLLTITGGKWTTYRKMAQDSIDRAQQLASLPPKACQTKKLPILPPEEPPLPDASPESQPLHPELPLTPAQIRHFVRHEMARRLDDVLSRRSRCLLLNARATLDIAPRVARLMAEELSLPASWADSELARFRELAQSYTNKRN
ncbi:MAG: glycerol-3-phosphate dehydrogenase C-terminal domain-containing protein, partial [Verrucomicrobiales bacterium]